MSFLSQRTKREKVLLLIISIASVITLSYLYVFQPKLTAIKTIQASIDKEKQKNNQLQTMLQHINQQKSSSKILNNVRTLKPISDPNVYLIKQLLYHFKAYNIAINGLSHESPIKKSNAIYEWTINTSLTGNYINIGRSLAALEKKENYIVKIPSLKMISNSEPSKLTTQITITILYATTH